MDNYVELTAEIVSNYVANNHVGLTELPDLIEQTHRALFDVGNPQPQAEPEVRANRRKRRAPEAQANEQMSDDQPDNDQSDNADGEMAESSQTIRGDSYGYDDDGKRIVPDPMFDDEA